MRDLDRKKEEMRKLTIKVNRDARLAAEEKHVVYIDRELTSIYTHIKEIATKGEYELLVKLLLPPMDRVEEAFYVVEKIRDELECEGFRVASTAYKLQWWRLLILESLRYSVTFKVKW